MPGLGDPLPLPDARDLGLLALLAFACTLLPFALSLVALRHLSAYSAQLAINLEPVYAILLAIPLLGEQRELSPQFYLGVAIVLLAVIVHPWTKRRAPVVVSRAGDQLKRVPAKQLLKNICAAKDAKHAREQKRDRPVVHLEILAS